VQDPPRCPRDTPLSPKVGTKFRQQVAVAESVEFACGLKGHGVCFVVCVCVSVWVCAVHKSHILPSRTFPTFPPQLVCQPTKFTRSFCNIEESQKLAQTLECSPGRKRTVFLLAFDHDEARREPAVGHFNCTSSPSRPYGPTAGDLSLAFR
jgi:hypothetical protein